LARQLSELLRELQRCRVRTQQLSGLSRQRELPTQLRDKLHDLALLLQAYHDWLREHQLQDADTRLDLAAAVLADPQSQAAADRAQPVIEFGELWLDGFAEMTAQEIHLLSSLLLRCRRATLAFCLDAEPRGDSSWLSTWSVVSRSFRAVQAGLSAVPGCQTTMEILPRESACGRFSQSPALAHLERGWATPSLNAECETRNSEREPAPPSQFVDQKPATGVEASAGPAVRLVCCADPEAEAIFAAREIRRWVRERGARFRDVAVLLRSFERYRDPLRRVFQRFEIPFFLDRRESVAHHPLAELTRFALRTVAYRWQSEDWFGALKTGLVPATEEEIDELETAALAHGWTGEDWHRPLVRLDDAARPAHLERIRQQVVPPFIHLAGRVAESDGRPDGAQLAEALRELWNELAVERTLADWSGPGSPHLEFPVAASVHATVWEQMRTWLDNLERGFRDVPVPLREWLSVIEAGFSGLTVGVVPPALDQVLIGTIDRSRNPDLRVAFVLGLNESIFPALPPTPVLLTETDRADLEQLKVNLSPNGHQRLGQEQYYGYIACTRAAERLIWTYAAQNETGRPLNPSPFLERLRRCFPGLEGETFSEPVALAEIEQVGEIIPRLIGSLSVGPLPESVASLAGLPAVAPVLAKAAQVASTRSVTALSPARVAGLYGTELRTSVTALEEFAACPFKFFVARGLRAAEREEFVVDHRERGSFQHEVLKAFHRSLEDEGHRWRDLSPSQASDRVARIGAELLPTFREGLLDRNPADRLVARLMIEALQQLVEVLVGWMPQYAFDPRAVEVGFGLEGEPWPGWSLDLNAGRRLVLRGRIDRVDLCASELAAEALAVVLDYKSRGRKLDATKLHHGLELQLLSYLNALVRTGGGRPELGRVRLQPAGAFHVGLHAQPAGARSRTEAHEAEADARTASYQHSGRFLADALEQFDNRQVSAGNQFKYRKNQNGEFSERGSEAMPGPDFGALLARSEAFLRLHAEAIFGGEVGVKPFRTSRETACEHCEFRSICRFDPWSQPYRFLAPPPKAPATPAPGQPGKMRKS
jgi:ATP-dependent helicase/nuclease subunit B